MVALSNRAGLATKATIESMSAQSDDPTRDEDGQRQQWDSVAAGWGKWWRTIENGAQCVSERMLDLAEVGPGHRVLDIATGIGEPALLAARRVGPKGRVVATDLSSRMLDIARERAASLGLTNVEFKEVDAERLSFPDGSFDVVLCRWGIMSLPHPSNTLVAIRRMLTPDGSFATAVWEAGPRGRPLASLASAVAREMFDSPSQRQEAPALPGSARKALEEEMTRARFRDIRVEELTLALDFPTAEDCIRYLMDVSPELAALLSARSSGERAEYRQSLADRLRQFATTDGGIRIPNVTNCAAGRR
jgi:ubiquinone/menaquinone biosynthesis C-methylase UbiE